ncbi:MAG TPA: tetratricopeptide repeat protein [Kofleriaceae bacterium]|nr:tetratricopeptide repeat protein [Kofleriaceae bacterium]
MAKSDAKSDFDNAAANVKSAPHSTAAWDEIEELAREHDKPDQVVALYNEILKKGLDPQVVEMIGERAGAFCDEWFGDDPKVAEGILGKALDLAPQSESALGRLSVLYTQSERWADLLRLYDRALTAVKDQGRRIKLLREAAQIAKDVANQPEKAIGYLQRLLPLTADDVQLGQSLERLLERYERWADLIALWEGRLERQSKAEREKSRVRIAGVYLDNLKDSAKALAAVRPLLAETDDDKEATGLLERIIEAQHTQEREREAALDVLRAHYDATSRPREVIRVLEKVIELFPDTRKALREEAGARLAELDDDRAAMDHYAELLALSPESSVTQEKLRQLAQRSNNFARYAEGVAAAAEHAIMPGRKVELLSEAARTKLDLLDDPPGAIALYQRALELPGASEKEQLPVCRRLSELYLRVDRPRERFAILERLAGLEPNDTTRRAVIGEAARLAEQLGETDKALSLWRQRIERDPDDLAAIDSSILLLEASQRWPELVAALNMRAQKNVSTAQKRTDLTRIAVVYRDHIKDTEKAIGAWQRVQQAFGDDAETVGALTELLSEVSRWTELADLLERTSGKDVERTTRRLNKLGEALGTHLGEPGRALAAYRGALAIDPVNAEARAGLLTLLDSAEHRKAAADALAVSYRENQDWGGFLKLLPSRLADAPDDRTRLALLREAAYIQLNNTNDPASALENLGRAFPLAPRDGVMEAQILDLAGKTGNFGVADQALAAGIRALAEDPGEQSRMRLVRAELLEKKMGDEGAALDEYLTVFARDRASTAAATGVVWLAPKKGKWSDAAAAVLGYAAAKERLDDGLFGHYAKEGEQALEAAVNALEQHAPTAGMPPAVAAQVWSLIGTWQRDRRGDKLSAIGAFNKSLAAGGDRADTLRSVAELQRPNGPSAPLLDVLRRLSDADPRDLDVLVEAADTASRLGDRDASVTILGQVLGRATSAWRGSTTVNSSRPAESVVRWAIDGLVDLHRAAGRARAAVDLLVESARLPFDVPTRRDLRMRAAAMASTELQDNAAAIDMYRGVLAESPGDLEIIARLGALLEAEGRHAELLGLRHTQLGLETDGAKRMDLRLDIARLVGVVEQTGGRYEALLANLADQPGHDASIDAAHAFLAGKGQHKAVADLLEEQAGKLESSAASGGEAQRAAKLWARAAVVAEKETREIERAIFAHKRVVTLAPTQDSFRALARLQLERNQPAQAVPWFESLLSTVSGAERQSVVDQLARAHIAAKQEDRAIATIEGALDDQDPALDLRLLLADLYRKGEQWEPLARHLTRSLSLFGDERGRELAREAASIYTEKLDAPAKAIPALEKALALDPDDKGMRANLATGLRVAGRVPEARAILTELIEGFGRRRSPERAQLHVELAKVAHAEGKNDEALTEMEAASKMDVNNTRIQRELAELCRAAGQVDKAERTYRALLLVVRRQPPADTDETAVGQSEVLFELSRLAAGHGDTSQAKELLESAIDAAVQSDGEVRRLRRSLIAHGEADTLLRVLEMRLAATSEAQSQARLYSDMADVLDGSLNRPADALEASIKAINLAPSRVDLHEKARLLAKRSGGTRKFVEAMETVVERLRRKDDPPLVAALLLKVGEALENDADDLAGAAAIYRRVEMLGERLAEAYYAQARVAGALGDDEQQARALDNMLQLAGGEGGDASPAQTDALYRLSEIFIANPARRAQGVDLIERAFAAEPRWAQAGRVLRGASSVDPGNARVMGLYERVARNGGDSELLLDFLEKRAQQPGATPAQVREAVDLAVEVGQDKRAEALLGRAVQAARDSADGVGSAVWAVLALAERRVAAGDLTTARELVYEIVGVAEPAEIDPLIGRVAARAAQDKPTQPLAAEMYELLRERSPSERTVWEPLVALYRDMGDGDRLASVITSTLPSLTDPQERNALRRAHAAYLIESLDRPHDAADVLRDALQDDPDDIVASQLLEKTLRALGDDDGLAEFLWARFDDAVKRGNRESTLDVAARLGPLVESTGGNAARVYRTALGVAPDDRDLLRKVVNGLTAGDDPRESAALMERLLAVETPDAAPALCWSLASAYEQAEDWAGVQRTLAAAHRSAPGDQAIHDRLEQFYRDTQQWKELAELMTGDAARATDAAVAVDRLREASAVYTGVLGQPLLAAEALRQARARQPEAPALSSELAAALAAAGDHRGAVTSLGDALDAKPGADPDDGEVPAPVQGPARVDLLLLRASLRQQLGEEDAAVIDLDDAYKLDGPRAAGALSDGLERMRTRAEQSGDMSAERTATLRLAQLLTEHGELERSRDLLVGWIERMPSDPDPLYILRDMDAAIEHWDGVIAACTRLAYIVESDAQVQAALDVADASARAGKPAEAIGVLEMVHGVQPGAEAVRIKLREQYEAAGAHGQLAAILMADAEHGTDVQAKFAAYKRAAELYLAAGDAASAAVPAGKAAELMPDDHQTAMLHVDILIGSGRTEEAANALETAIAAQKKRTPELATMQQRMGRVAGMLGDRDGQLGWLKKAFDVDRKNGEIAAELAQLATEIGDYELALKPLRAITLMDNPLPITRPMALLWEAKIEHARGNRAKAELWAKKALREDPQFQEAQQFLDELA